MNQVDGVSAARPIQSFDMIVDALSGEIVAIGSASPATAAGESRRTLMLRTCFSSKDEAAIKWNIIVREY
jgi:hypothetical protein